MTASFLHDIKVISSRHLFIAAILGGFGEKNSYINEILQLTLLVKNIPE